MAFGDYDGPDKPNKGHEGGACNRSRCQAEPANWWNHGSHSWYCADCARDIGDDVVNARMWPIDFRRMFPGRDLHPMFETRQQMDARAAIARDRSRGMSVILESTNRAAVDRWIAPWLNADDREFDRLTSDYRRMMADADANQLARGRHQFTDASGLIERENGL